MTIQDCIKFTNENPICYVATVENDQPRVRALGFGLPTRQVSIFKPAL